MKNMMRCPFTVCILLFLCALTSCAKTGEIIMESPETKKDHLQAEMVSFFQEHQTEMQAFALQMEELNDSDPIYDYRYAVKENALIQFDGEHIKAQGKSRNIRSFQMQRFFEKQWHSNGLSGLQYYLIVLAAFLPDMYMMKTILYTRNYMCFTLRMSR